MFWSGNYIAVRELNSLLKEENVTLSQILEADDILQECKLDNKALIQFLTKPEILADLITLITEEPPKNVEIATQYRYANIACEVLTSHLSMLSDRLSLDVTQMNRLCDFLNRDPPLNPLLASYFSKTVEMLLEKSPKQDWCLHHIVCLRVLDFFKSRRDFLPNLLRHMSTSAIADVFKYLMRIDDLIKTVMEWLEEHQFLECLIQIICGTYEPEVFPTPLAVNTAPPQEPKAEVEKAEHETSEKTETNHVDHKDSGGVDVDGDKGAEECNIDKDERAGGESIHTNATEGGAEAEVEAEARRRSEVAAERRAAVASANAAALLCDLIIHGCRAAEALRAEALLGAVFTAPAAARRRALVHGVAVLQALLPPDAQQAEGGAVERAVAPHLPLLHQALLHAPRAAVGLPRLQVAALLARLALSAADEVAATMLTLGTPGVLVDMFFAYPNNNFLHAHVYALVKHALHNRAYRTQYARHLLVECDLLTRLMDAFEENKNNKAASSGHCVLLLGACARALGAGDALALPASVAERWAAFRDDTLKPLLARHDTPLGGYYPSENFYEVEIMPDPLAASYEFNEAETEVGASAMDELADDLDNDDVSGICGAVGMAVDSPDFIADALGIEDSDQLTKAKSNFLELASQRFGADMWDEPEADAEAGAEAEAEEEAELDEAAADVLRRHAPWEATSSAACGGEEGEGEGEGWAQFAPPSPPAAPHDPFAEFSPYWPAFDNHTESSPTAEVETRMDALRLDSSSASLASNLLTAMADMSPDAIANIVNANADPHS